MKFKARPALKRTKIEIIPMIDTMFFLLVFFMLSSLALTRLMGIPVNLPQSSTATRASVLDLTVSIDKQGQVYLDKEPISVRDLGAAIVQRAGGPQADLSKASVVINADETVPYGMIIACIDEARSVGVTHFPLATSKKT